MSLFPPFLKFIDLRERERKEWREEKHTHTHTHTERERNVDLLFHLLIHSLVASCMCPDQGSNLQPWPIGVML